MAQMKVDGGAPEANLARAAEMIREAASKGCEVVVLPECLDVGWTHPLTRELAQPIPGPHSDALVKQARAAGIWVVAGLAEREADLIYNSAVLISPEGEIALKHRKINILKIAQPFYAVGDRLGVAHTPLGTIAVDICADNFNNSLVFAHGLARMGARIILSPCAWAVDAGHDNQKDPYGSMWKKAYSTIAKLYDIPIVGVSNVGWIRAGPWEGKKCIGCSLAVGRSGEVLAEGPYGEEAEALIAVDLDLTPLPVKGTELAGWLKSKGYEGP